MIISRTPFRVSFFGGGTDYPAFYRENGGAVLSTSIDKYCYIILRYLPPFFDHKYRVRYTKREETQSIAEIQHPSARECLNFIPLEHGVEIQHNADLPAMSGIGSSSAFTVGLLNALYALKGQMKTKRQLVLDAVHVEQNMIRENVGSQDQTAAAFGGFNKIEFGGSQEIVVYPLTITPARLDYFRKHLMLLYTGYSRNASEIAEAQVKATSEKQNELTAMRGMVEDAISIIASGGDSLAEFGELLHETWQIKRSLTPYITNPQIDDLYDTARRAGALGGKLLGAGSGGFFLLFVQPERRQSVAESLSELLQVPFRFDTMGSQIVYYAPQTDFYTPSDDTG